MPQSLRISMYFDDWLINWVNVACTSFPSFLDNHLRFCLHFCFIRRMISMPIGRLELTEFGRFVSGKYRFLKCADFEAKTGCADFKAYPPIMACFLKLKRTSKGPIVLLLRKMHYAVNNLCTDQINLSLAMRNHFVDRIIWSIINTAGRLLDIRTTLKLSQGNVCATTVSESSFLMEKFSF